MLREIAGIAQRNGSQRMMLVCTAAVLFGLLCPRLLAQTWEIEVLDNGKQFTGMTDRSLRLDPQGRPHISYGGDWLYYAFFDGVEWQYEVADSASGVGRDASLVLDSSGYPHVSYSRRIDIPSGDTDLKYAYKDATGWHVQTVDVTGLVGAHSSLALDGSGHPHISYYDDTNNDLKYAYEDAAGWHIVTVAADGMVGYYCSLALDASGYPHISYDASSPDYDLRYAYEDATGWHFEIVDSEGHVGWYTSIALDGADLPHISYATWIQVGSGCQTSYHADDLKYAYKDGAGWRFETVDSEGYTGYYTSLGLDVLGYPHIGYSNETNSNLKYAFRDQTGWHLQAVTPGGGFTSLALDSLGYPHIGFSGLRYAYEDGTGWHVETVDSSRDVGSCPSLVLDGSGNLHVSYWATEALRYVARDDELAHSQIVDAAASGYAAHGDNSLALDSSVHPHVSYYGYTNQDLNYAFHDVTGWHLETVDSLGDVGYYNALALDGAGYPHIGYYDNTNGRLKYACEDETGWHLQIADSQGGNVGYDISLALDASEYPHISYYENANDDLRYAHEDAAGWHVQIVDSEGDVGSHTSLALDDVGYPHIGYYDNTNGRLKYAYQNGAGWHLETVGSAAYESYSPSLALDISGYPHISYFYGMNGDLKYAYKNETGWHLQIVDAEGWVGEYCSLRLDSVGHAHICYYDYTNKDLKYARMVERLAPAGPVLLAASPAVPLQISAVDVWPNPAKGVVHAMLAMPEGQGMVRLTVVDLLGRRVMSLQQPEATGAEGTITLRLPESIPTGQYLLGVEGDGARQFVPITVVK